MSKRWCYTLNNYSEEEYTALQQQASCYHVMGSEIGKEGTPHIQGFITFAKAKRLSGVKKINGRAHWEKTRETSDIAANYCKKDGLFWEQGKVPTQGKRTDLESVADMVKEGKSIKEIAEEYPTQIIKFHRGIRELQILQAKPYNHDGVRGVWYYGPPGTGKSRKAREENPDAYIKPQNKWFDGYSGEKVIILDDLDTSMLQHYLKIWADRYACSGETKGGTVHLQHHKFIVTSNYSIEQLWPDDDVMRQAIARRFTATRFGGYETIQNNN